MGDVSAHIESWLEAGLIDEATAARLRAAEAVAHGAQAPGRAAPRSAALQAAPVLADPGSAASVIGTCQAR